MNSSINIKTMLTHSPFLNRSSAGKKLAERLKPDYAGRNDVAVLALPRGGVPVAYEIAATLKAPLDVMLVRKLGVPGHRELAMGAIAAGDFVVMNSSVVEQLNISQASIDRVIAEEKQELQRRNQLYRQNRKNYALKDKFVILVDDGIATGATMRAAVAAIKQMQPAKLVVAVPTAAESSRLDIAPEVDEFVALITPINFYAVGAWYVDFAQVSDNEVIDLLEKNRQQNSKSVAI